MTISAVNVSIAASSPNRGLNPNSSTPLAQRPAMLDLQSPAPSSRDGALHIVFRAGKLVSDPRSSRPCVLFDRDLIENGWAVEREQFVGFYAGEPCFAVDIGEATSVDDTRFMVGSLYHLVGRVDDQLFALTGRAAQLLDWQRDHRYCGRCGAPNDVADGGRALGCSERNCAATVYPRIAPCVIVLVTRGEDMLLARNARFPRPMYSTLAGFVEAGESVEATLLREVQEEVGVEVTNPRYFSSQSWPFPNQLMLGFFAQYSGGDITPDGDEIAEAGWYHPRELPPVPPPASIAGQLIQEHCRRVLA